MDDLINSYRLPFDIRAEVLARLIAERYDLSKEQLLVRHRNYFQRQGRKEVLEISDGFSDSLEKTMVCLDISREGLFDILPEDIFLHPDEIYATNLTRSQALTEQEVFARKLFYPLEQLFFYMGLENECKEHELENQLETIWQQYIPDSVSIFKGSSLDDDQKAIIKYLIPYLPEIIGNWPLTEQWLSMIMKTPILLKEIPFISHDLPEEVQKRVGGILLGQDFILGNQFSDGLPILHLLIEDLTPDNIADFLEDGVQRKLLEEELLSIFLPIETSYEIRLGLKTQSTFFKLEHDADNSILGFTTVLEKTT